MLKLELEKVLEKGDKFKRYNNGKGYVITTSTSDTFKCYQVFISNEGSKYIPAIYTDIRLEPLDDNYFSIESNIRLKKSNPNVIVSELEDYLVAYKIARDSVEEFREAIRNGEI